jgi:hypothetical protein
MVSTCCGILGRYLCSGSGSDVEDVLGPPREGFDPLDFFVVTNLACYEHSSRIFDRACAKRSA